MLSILNNPHTIFFRTKILVEKSRKFMDVFYEQSLSKNDYFFNLSTKAVFPNFFLVCGTLNQLKAYLFKFLMHFLKFA